MISSVIIVLNYDTFYPYWHNLDLGPREKIKKLDLVKGQLRSNQNWPDLWLFFNFFTVL